MNFAKFLRAPFLTELTQSRTPVAASERWKIVKPITLQINVFTKVTDNRVNDHYASNVYIKVFL